MSEQRCIFKQNWTILCLWSVIYRNRGAILSYDQGNSFVFINKWHDKFRNWLSLYIGYTMLRINTKWIIWEWAVHLCDAEQRVKCCIVYIVYAQICTKTLAQSWWWWWWCNLLLDFWLKWYNLVHFYNF